MKYIDRPFLFVDHLGLLSRCHVRIARPSRIKPAEGFALVIVSALAGAEGASPTNAFEQLAPQIAGAFGLDGSSLIYIEHVGPFSYEDGQREEEFSRVAYTFAPEARPRIPSGAKLSRAATALENQRPTSHPLSKKGGPVDPDQETVATFARKLRAASRAGSFTNPRWSITSRSCIEELIGAELPPFPFQGE